VRRRSDKQRSGGHVAPGCHQCDAEAPSARAVFKQNVGVFVSRFETRTAGYFCRSCLHEQHWKSTGITMVVGWFGVISFFLTPVFILQNAQNYIRALRTLDRARTERRESRRGARTRRGPR